MTDKAKPKNTSRLARTLRALVLMVLLGVALSAYSSYTASRDLRLAIGPQSAEQRAFFVDAATRPDIATFFKKLTHEQRMTMSRNIGRYDDAALANLIGQILADFDSEARGVLTESLVVIAKKHPDAVAEQLKQKGSFQTIAISRALHTNEDAALPFVVKQLTVADARNNAISFLVEAGAKSVEPVLPMLEHKDKDVRLAAADALGKLRAKTASAALLRHYQSSKGDERLGYLTALAGIGDASDEPLMTSVLSDADTPVPQRAQAALGLGRIGTISASGTLWKYAEFDDATIAQSAVTALQRIGAATLAQMGQRPETRLRVAAGIDAKAADDEIRKALQDSATRITAAKAAYDREALVPDLVVLLKSLNPEEEGGTVDALLAALNTTPSGKAEVSALKSEPRLYGLIERRSLMTK